MDTFRLTSQRSFLDSFYYSAHNSGMKVRTNQVPIHVGKDNFLTAVEEQEPDLGRFHALLKQEQLATLEKLAAATGKNRQTVLRTVVTFGLRHAVADLLIYSPSDLENVPLPAEHLPPEEVEVPDDAGEMQPIRLRKNIRKVHDPAWIKYRHSMMDYELGGEVGPRPKPPLSEEDKAFNRRLRAEIEAHQGKAAADAVFADSDAAAAISRVLRVYSAVRDGAAAADAAFADDAITRETQAYLQSACKEAYAAANPPQPRKPPSPSDARRRLREYLEGRDGKAATDAVFADSDAAAAISWVFRVHLGNSNRADMADTALAHGEVD